MVLNPAKWVQLEQNGCIIHPLFMEKHLIQSIFKHRSSKLDETLDRVKKLRHGDLKISLLLMKDKLTEQHKLNIS